eukprot:scaffold127068_cov19-Tisochrysis_lutea.AAC.1
MPGNFTYFQATWMACGWAKGADYSSDSGTAGPQEGRTSRMKQPRVHSKGIPGHTVQKLLMQLHRCARVCALASDASVLAWAKSRAASKVVSTRDSMQPAAGTNPVNPINCQKMPDTEAMPVLLDYSSWCKAM